MALFLPIDFGAESELSDFLIGSYPDSLPTTYAAKSSIAHRAARATDAFDASKDEFQNAVDKLMQRLRGTSPAIRSKAPEVSVTPHPGSQAWREFSPRKVLEDDYEGVALRNSSLGFGDSEYDRFQRCCQNEEACMPLRNLTATLNLEHEVESPRSASHGSPRIEFYKRAQPLNSLLAAAPPEQPQSQNRHRESLEALMAQNEVFQQQLADSRAQLDSARMSHASLRTKHEELVAGLKAQNQVLQQQLTDVRAELDSARVSNASLQTEREELMSGLKDAREKMTMLQDVLSDGQKDSTLALNIKDSTIERLQWKLREERELAERLRHEMIRDFACQREELNLELRQETVRRRGLEHLLGAGSVDKDAPPSPQKIRQANLAEQRPSRSSKEVEHSKVLLDSMCRRNLSSQCQLEFGQDMPPRVIRQQSYASDHSMDMHNHPEHHRSQSPPRSSSQAGLGEEPRCSRSTSGLFCSRMSVGSNRSDSPAPSASGRRRANVSISPSRPSLSPSPRPTRVLAVTSALPTPRVVHTASVLSSSLPAVVPSWRVSSSAWTVLSGDGPYAGASR